MTNWQEEIENDLKWRESELVVLKILTFEAKSDSTRQSVLLRALVLMLYAHYEGFCKFVWDLYLSAIEEQKIKRSTLNDSLICLSLENELREIQKDLSPERLLGYFNVALPQAMCENAKFATGLSTKSNLRSKIFIENNGKINISVPIMKEEHRVIDSLVGRRNDIAHGQKNIIQNIEDYKKYEDSVFLVIYELALQVIEAIHGKTYLANGA